MSIADSFGRAADYDHHAAVQRTVAERLAEHVAALPLPPAPHVLEIGCGTGLLGAALINRLPGARWLMTDLRPRWSNAPASVSPCGPTSPSPQWMAKCLILKARLT